MKLKICIQLFNYSIQHSWFQGRLYVTGFPLNNPFCCQGWLICACVFKTQCWNTARRPHNAQSHSGLFYLLFRFLTLPFFSLLPFSTVSTLNHSLVLLFLLCCSFSGLHFCPVPSFSRSNGNISQQTDHLGVRPVNVLIVIYSWTEFKKSFSLLTTWSRGPGNKKKFAPFLSP